MVTQMMMPTIGSVVPSHDLEVSLRGTWPGIGAPPAPYPPGVTPRRHPSDPPADRARSRTGDGVA